MKWLKSFYGLFIIATLCVAAFSSSAFAQTKTISRTHDPVIVTGAKLPGMAGKHIRTLRLYSAKGGKVYPIPFQVDERDPSGKLALPIGKKATRDNDNGAFDDNDELVFMAIDLADKITGDKIRRLLKGVASISEIEVKDPVNGKKGWAYLLSFTGVAPKPSPIDYVRYDKKKRTVKTPLYMVRYGPKANSAFLDGVFLSKEGGGPGFHINQIDRMKIRVDGKLKIGIGVHKTEDDFITKILAYKDGPVRLIRRSKNAMILALNIPSMSLIMEDTYYRSFYEYPASIKSPVSLGIFFKNLELRATYDLAEIRGKKLYTSGNPEGILVDGKPGADEKRLKKDGHKWLAIASTLPDEKGAFVGIFRYSEPPEKFGMVIEVYFNDDSSKMDPPERIPGSFGQIGILTKHVEKAPKGTRTINTYLFNVPVFSPKKMKPIFNVLDRPLVATAKGI